MSFSCTGTSSSCPVISLSRAESPLSIWSRSSCPLLTSSFIALSTNGSAFAASLAIYLLAILLMDRMMPNARLNMRNEEFP